MSIVSAVLLIPIVGLLYYNNRLNVVLFVHRGGLAYDSSHPFSSGCHHIFMSLCLAFVLLYIKISQNRWNKAIDSMKPNMLAAAKDEFLSDHSIRIDTGPIQSLLVLGHTFLFFPPHRRIIPYTEITSVKQKDIHDMYVTYHILKIIAVR